MIRTVGKNFSCKEFRKRTDLRIYPLEFRCSSQSFFFFFFVPGAMSSTNGTRTRYCKVDVVDRIVFFVVTT